MLRLIDLFIPVPAVAKHSYAGVRCSASHRTALATRSQVTLCGYAPLLHHGFPLPVTSSTALCSSLYLRLLHIYRSSQHVSFHILGSLAAASACRRVSLYLQSPPSVPLPLSHCSTVLNCPRICVRSMNRIAFVATLCSFKIARRSSRPIPESSSQGLRAASSE